jgi:UDP-glucose 4-epimerase
MNILVCGGAGYIGSHMVKLLLARGHRVAVLDNLSTGYRDAVLTRDFHLCDLAERKHIDAVLQQERFDAVMHFAAFIRVQESVSAPAKYFRNNLCNTLNLLDSMIEHGVHHFIFSSTAAVYGEPRQVPIDETHPREPINPYGASKRMVEDALDFYSSAHGLRSVSLRFSMPLVPTRNANSAPDTTQ